MNFLFMILELKKNINRTRIFSPLHILLFFHSNKIFRNILSFLYHDYYIIITIIYITPFLRYVGIGLGISY